MIVYKYKKLTLIIESILIGTLFPLSVIKLILMFFGKYPLSGDLIIVTIFIWLLLNLGLVANIFHELEVNDSIICRKTFLSIRTIKWEDVSLINFKSFRKKVTITQVEKTKISIDYDYQDFKKLYLHIEDILSKNEKYNIIPEELRNYFIKIKQED